MKLLIITQAVDANDVHLSFFPRWLAELSKHFEHITVFALRVGAYDAPKNVDVVSLRPYGNQGRIRTALRFLWLSFKFRNEYDAVFVHMNQEYILVGWKLFWLLGKPIYLWRNHYQGSFLTNIAATVCRKVFCTSRYSYTARFKKTVLMPVGVDTTRFSDTGEAFRTSRSILFFGRMAPSKHPEVLIDALMLLKEKGVEFTASFYGSPSPGDEAFVKDMEKRAAPLAGMVAFHPGVPHQEAPNLFRARAIFVNLGESGMLDKTIFEAAACGCRVLAASEDWKGMAGKNYWFDGTPADLAEKLEGMLAETSHAPDALQRVAAENSLSMLGGRLAHELQG